jgi:hypothetical protein
MADDRDFTSYVAARWTHLVRGLVALGAPLAVAHTVAADTLSSCHDGWADISEWVDPDVRVVDELLRKWNRQRQAWWERPERPADVEALTEAGWPELEALLDRMTVPDRRALVLQDVVGLSPQQLRDVTGGVGRPPLAPGLDLVGVLDLVPVYPAPVGEMIAASEHRRRRRRVASLAGGVGLLAVVAIVAALVVSQSDSPAGEARETFGPVRSQPYDNPSPVAWYAAGTLYLPHSQIPLPDVREFGQWDDGAVYLDVRGNLVTVTADGERERIATLGSDGTFAVSDTANLVAWVDPEGPELILHDLDAGERRLESTLAPEGARFVAVDDARALLSSGDDLFRVDLTDGSIEPTVDRRLPGELDRHGRYVLTQEGGGAATARVRLYDTSASRPLSLPMAEPRTVTAARFGPDGSVMLLFEPPGAKNSQIRRCPPPYDGCGLVAHFPAGGARSLLAQ